MKKFLSKKPVMISLLVAAVLVLALYIGMLARPVALGWTYSDVEAKDGVTVTTKMKFGGKTIKGTMTTKTVDGEETENYEMYYYRDGNKVWMLAPTELMSEEDYDKLIEEIKKMKKEDKAAYEAEVGDPTFTINAFSATQKMGDETTKISCNATTIFAVVAGVIELVLIAGAVMSTLYVVKKK